MRLLRLLAPTLLMVIALVLVLVGVAWWVAGRHIWRATIQTQEPEDTRERLDCGVGMGEWPDSASVPSVDRTMSDLAPRPRLFASLHSRERWWARGVGAGGGLVVKDLVYAMAVSPQDSMARSESQDRRYQFCGRGWQAAFEQSHERYLNLAVLLERLGGIADLDQTGYAETPQTLVGWAERPREVHDHPFDERAPVDVQTRICGSELWLG